MWKRRTYANNVVLAVIFVVGTGMMSPALAFFDPPLEELLGETKITLMDAVSTALREVPGKVYEVELEREEGQVAFEVKIQDNQGQKQEIYIDAKTGKVLSTEIEKE